MSLLNRPSDGIYPVLIALFKLLENEKGGLPKDQLLALCAPPAHCTGATDHASNTLNTWLSFGLFERKKDDVIAIHSDIPSKERKLAHLKRLARKMVLSKENNEDLWATEKSRAADFTRTLCWFLAQDAWTMEATSWDRVERQIRTQLPDGADILRNDTRWPGFKEWAEFLGFGWRSHVSKGTTPDPTDAVRETLPVVFGKQKSLSPGDFTARLAEQLPVLDGGAYRLEVEKILNSTDDADSWRSAPDGQISSSLSRALLRLSEEGSLILELKADSSERVALTGRESRPIKEISAFILPGK